MERPITGYHLDESGDWVAELHCGHDQHVRHRPPFQLRAWVLDTEGRAARLGSALTCLSCARAEMPGGLRWVRTTPTWDQDTIPGALRRAHRIAPGTWGRIVVHSGRLRFVATPFIDRQLSAAGTQAIPPGVEHHVEAVGVVRFGVEFFAVDRGDRFAQRTGNRPGELTEAADEGGDPACWAGRICPRCGGVVGDGEHRADCLRGGPIE